MTPKGVTMTPKDLTPKFQHAGEEVVKALRQADLKKVLLAYGGLVKVYADIAYMGPRPQLAAEADKLAKDYAQAAKSPDVAEISGNSQNVMDKVGPPAARSLAKLTKFLAKGDLKSFLQHYGGDTGAYAWSLLGSLRGMSASKALKALHRSQEDLDMASMKDAKKVKESVRSESLHEQRRLMGIENRYDWTVND